MKEIPFKIVCLILLFASLESCSKYSNIYEIKPQSALIKDKEYLEFENDTVKITYSFWGKAGVMSYTIFNKMNIPIYIDWKKSSVVKNEQKYDYWVDEINTKSKSQSTGSSNSSLYYGGYNLFNYNLVKSESKSIKPERVTFLSPKSSVTRMQSILYNLVPEKLLQPVRKGKLLDKDGKKNVTVDYIEMSKNESTFSFRNFLTISTTEKFENEIYIDNGFYISRVNKIKTLELVPITKYNKKKDKDEIEYPFSSPKMFYIDL